MAHAIEEKPFIKPVLEEPASGTAADFVADKLTYDPATKLAVATGRVVLTYGPYTLNATPRDIQSGHRCVHRQWLG